MSDSKCSLETIDILKGLFVDISMSNLVAIASACIALFVMLLMIWQGFLTRKHNRLSLRPILKFKWSYTDNSFSCKLNNLGTGAAFIRKVNIFIGDEKIKIISKEHYNHLLEKLDLKGQGVEFSAFHLTNDTVLSVGDILNVFTLKTPKDKPEVYDLASNNLKNMSIQIEYSCVYDVNYKTNVSSFL